MGIEAGANRTRYGRLLRTPKPWPDESLMAFILRLTESNYYDLPSWILELSGLTTYSFVLGPPDKLERLSRLTGVGVPELADLGHPPAGAEDSLTYNNCFFGLPVPKYCLRVESPKLCPVCLAESPYFRRVWDLAAVTVCPIHRVMLIDECPQCSRRIGWRRRKVCACRCEFDFRRAEAASVGAAELSLTEHIHRLCGLLTPGRNAEGDSNNPLLELTLNDCLRALLFIAGQYQNILDTKGKNIATQKQNSEIHALLLRAWAVFDDWPRNYFEFLTWRRTHKANGRPSDICGTGLKRDFGKFYYGLFEQLAASKFDFLRDGFGKYLSQHWPGGYLGMLSRPKLNGLRAADNKYVTNREARRLLGIDLCWLDRFVEMGKLEAVVVTRSRGRRFYLVDVKSLEELKRALDSALTANAIVRQLRITSATLPKLVRSGLLEALRGPTADGSRHWGITQRAIDDLFRRIRETIRRDPNQAPGREVNFYYAKKKLRMTVVDLISAILGGEISPCGESDERGFSRFRFKVTDVEEYKSRAGVAKVVYECRKMPDVNEGQQPSLF
jgi:TniQ